MTNLSDTGSVEFNYYIFIYDDDFCHTSFGKTEADAFLQELTYTSGAQESYVVNAITNSTCMNDLVNLFNDYNVSGNELVCVIVKNKNSIVYEV